MRIENEWTTTGGEEERPFLIHDSGADARNRIAVFATEDGLRHLAGSDTWFMDGTFSSAPALFEQIFVIRAHLGESAVRRALKKTSQAGNQGPTGTTKKPMR